MQIRITRLTLSPPPGAGTTTATTVGWRCNGSTGAFTTVTTNAQVRPDGTLVTPINIIFDNLACPNGIQVIAYTNCGGQVKTVVMNPNVTTTASTSSTTSSTTAPVTTVTTTTTINPNLPCPVIDTVEVVDVPNPTTTQPPTTQATTTSTTTVPVTTTITTTICPNVTDIEWEVVIIET